MRKNVKKKNFSILKPMKKGVGFGVASGAGSGTGSGSISQSSGSGSAPKCHGSPTLPGLQMRRFLDFKIENHKNEFWCMIFVSCRDLEFIWSSKCGYRYIWSCPKGWFYGPDVTLQDCLSLFFSEDELKGDNMYSCEKCKKLRNGLKFSEVKYSEFLINLYEQLWG